MNSQIAGRGSRSVRVLPAAAIGAPEVLGFSATADCRQICNCQSTQERPATISAVRNSLAIVRCMENSESLQASSDDEEAFLAELKQRPSTFPNIGADL